MSGAYKSADLLQCLPSAANGAAVTPSGIAEGWSNWAEITPAAASDLRLAAIVVRPGSFADGNYYEVEIGVGALGVEAPVAAGRGMSGFNAGGTAESGSVLQLAIPADVIPSGSRVSARLRQASTNTSPWSVAIQFWALPLLDSVMPASTVGPVNEPSGSRIAVSTGASTGTFGAWAEVTPASDGPWTIGNVLCFGPNFVDWELEIGTGSAGAEVTLWTVKSTAAWFASANAWQGGPWNILLRPPFGPVATGSRIAIRIRSMNASGIKAFRVGFTVTKQSVSRASTRRPMEWTPFTLLTVAGGGWGVYSAWTEVIASTPNPIAVCNISSTRDNTGFTLYEVGVGDPGAETVVARVVCGMGVGFGGGKFNLPLPYARLIPTGSRVSIRMTVAGTSAGLGHYASMGYIDCADSGPDFDNYVDDVVPDVYTNLPSSLPLSMASSASAWVSGSWVQIDASVPVDRVIAGFAMQVLTVPVDAEVDLGVGGAGAEVAVATLRWEATDVGSGTSMFYTPLPVPIVIPEASRLAMRLRTSAASAVTAQLLWLYSTAPVTPPEPDPNVVVPQTFNIRRVRECPVVSAEGQRLRHVRLQIDLRPGLGSVSGSDPVVILERSYDGGLTWQPPCELPVGKMGQFWRRVQRFRLGSPRNAVYRIIVSDPSAAWVLPQAFIDLEDEI